MESKQRIPVINKPSQGDALARLRTRLEERIRSTRREPKLRSADMSAEMQRFQDRKQKFERISPHLTEAVLPRLSHLASLFSNANLGAHAANDRVTCWLATANGLLPLARSKSPYRQ